MPHKESDDSRVLSVRLPNPLVQRLDRVLDWQTTHRRRPATRNAAMRDALQDWLDHQEQLAGLLEPHVLRQQFQAKPRQHILYVYGQLSRPGFSRVTNS
jgi:hypothetical protein